MSYEIAIALHVVVAILGIGQVTGLTVVAAIAKRSSPIAPATWAALKQLARGASWSLLVMLLTGLWLEALAGGAHGRSLWFPIAFVLFVVCGALLGMTQGALRKGEAAGNASVLPGVVTRGWALCALVAIIAALMQLKPW
jgi:hypothetical protein